MPPTSSNKWRAFTHAKKRAKAPKSQFNAKIDTEVLEAFKACCSSHGIEMQTVIEQAMREYIEQMSQPQLSVAPQPLRGSGRVDDEE